MKDAVRRDAAGDGPADARFDRPSGYAERFASYLEATDEKDVIAQALRQRLRPGTVLDVGAGAGHLASRLGVPPVLYSAVEQNPELADQLSARGITVYEGSFRRSRRSRGSTTSCSSYVLRTRRIGIARSSRRRGSASGQVGGFWWSRTATARASTRGCWASSGRRGSRMGGASPTSVVGRATTVRPTSPSSSATSTATRQRLWLISWRSTPPTTRSPTTLSGRPSARR